MPDKEENIILDFFYRYLLGLFFFSLFHLFFKIRISGLENVPKDSNFILASNHRSFMDGPLIGYLLSPRVIHWIIARWVYEKWIFKPFCFISRCVAVGGSSLTAEKVLNRGGIIGIFPEGGVCCDRYIKSGHKGVAVLALKTGVPVLPCYVDGTFNSRRKPILSARLFTTVRVIIGKPVRFDKITCSRVPAEAIEKTLPEIIAAINNLSPA